MHHSNQSDQFSLFDDLDSEAEKVVKQIQNNVREWMAEFVPCHFCGERMGRGTMAFNHGIVFNGWCMKALMFHTRSRGRLHTHTEEAAWLQSHGIDPNCDSHDEANWRTDLRDAHFDGHYGQCYSSEDCK